MTFYLFSRATRVKYLYLIYFIYLSISLTTHEENFVIDGQRIFTGDR